MTLFLDSSKVLIRARDNEAMTTTNENILLHAAQVYNMP